MELTSPSFSDGASIPPAYCLGAYDPDSHVTFAADRNPALEWTGVPEGTRSLAITCVDPDAPSVADDANKEDRQIPADFPRADFTHWALVDLDPATRSIDEAEYSDGVTPRGKPGSRANPREGVNDYTGWFAGDPDMEGTYRGYDGPCPPWNDTIIHHYVFTVYALDVDHLDVDEDFSAGDLITAAHGHVLDSASITGVYTLNPDLF
ncbi:MAG: YbhB/YbcL family Raf kinase inhibitor-like protein [Acidimicrobiia bacterium]